MLTTVTNSPLGLGRNAALRMDGGQTLAEVARDLQIDAEQIRAALVEYADRLREYATGFVAQEPPAPVAAGPEPVLASGPLGAGPSRIPERLREHGWLWGLVHRTGRPA